MPKLRVPALVAPALALFTLTTAGVSVAGAKPVRPRTDLARYKPRVQAATVMLPERGCAGSIVRSAREIVTAAHCVPESAITVDVKLPDGSETSARVAHRDEDGDVALLELDVPAAVTPLPLADDVPRRGSTLLFVGRTDRRSRTQLVRVDKVERCPSLPSLPNALFTSLDARPGDSGAPLIDGKGRVAALVHGGARCEIAVPTAALAAVKLDPLRTPRPSAGSPVPERGPAREGDAAKDDGWFFQRTDRGFRFRWSFRWRSD